MAYLMNTFIELWDKFLGFINIFPNPPKFNTQTKSPPQLLEYHRHTHHDLQTPSSPTSIQQKQDKKSQGLNNIYKNNTRNKKIWYQKYFEPNGKFVYHKQKKKYSRKSSETKSHQTEQGKKEKNEPILPMTPPDSSQSLQQMNCNKPIQRFKDDSDNSRDNSFADIKSKRKIRGVPTFNYDILLNEGFKKIDNDIKKEENDRFIKFQKYIAEEKRLAEQRHLEKQRQAQQQQLQVEQRQIEKQRQVEQQRQIEQQQRNVPQRSVSPSPQGPTIPKPVLSIPTGPSVIVSSPDTSIASIASPTAEKLYNSCRKKFIEASQAVNIISNQYPNERQNILKGIRTSFNQLSAKRRQVISKSLYITDLLSKIKNNNNLYLYAMNEIANTIIRQSNVQVKSNPDSCYQYAYVIINVSNTHPLLIDIMLGNFHNSCPYTVPMYPPRKHGVSEADYKVNILKYKSQEDGMESQESYNKRMTGISRVFSAFLLIGAISKTRISFDDLWGWLARCLNLNIKNDIFKEVILTFLQQTAYFLHGKYKNQFVKLIALIEKEYVLQNAPSPSQSRLMTFIKDFRDKRDQFQRPKGFDLEDEPDPNFDNVDGPDDE